MKPLVIDGVSFRRDGRMIIDNISLSLEPGDHWVVIGANGSGKSTLLRLAAMYEHPSSGTVTVLGETLGHTDVRRLRRRIGYAAAGLGDQIRPAVTVGDVVVSGRYAALETYWDHYGPDDWAAARQALDQMRVEHLIDQPFGTVSSGERQRVLLARTLVNSPGLVLLDEPSAGLDIAGREELVDALDSMMRLGVPTVVITHHLSEIAPSTTHAVLLRDGRSTVAGPISEVLTSTNLSECFGIPLEVERRSDGRFAAWSRSRTSASPQADAVPDESHR